MTVNEKLLPILRCPVCGEHFEIEGGSLKCTGARRHCFDVASSGYVNFAGSGGGDSKDAVRARRRFLSLGYYRPVAEGIVRLLEKYLPDRRCVVDAGCGEGYYDGFISDAGYPVVGFDLSRPAVEAAAKRKLPDSFFAVAGINAMPVTSGSVGAVVNVFAPCFEEEFSRVTAPGGIVLLVGAGKDHLRGMKSVLYENVTVNTERTDLPVGMRLAEKKTLAYDVTLTSGGEIADLFSMTPYYFRTERSAAEKLLSLDRLETKLEFDFYVYIKE